MRVIVILAFLGILASLASAFIYLMRDKGGSNRTVNALTVRIGLSILLFLFVLLAHHQGWIESTGITFRPVQP
ncbi:twin transmembrane helix small protein [Pusillimonas sp. DMV24BSW_D]|uniref:twin transmembrane helix small protein n=1 Tax=Neopusillimonas aestuarii TaxID=2716226 RepID=UPI0014079FED|nr:twin transmembrane helix small protein [Pusillimonas sp. DMV24BSW_D]QIM47965.1 twin transmembrane helix small protein [Pusillimonas sp. DMV24BSW_D]